MLLISIIFNTRFLISSKIILQEWYQKESPHKFNRNELFHTAITQAHVYETLILKSHLPVGMLANVSHDGYKDLCDSLLFSTLRYVALKKLGFIKNASKAWNHIIYSKINKNQWVRHPLCTETLSKDMFLGVLSMLTQEERGWESELKGIVQYLNSHSGYIDSGPIYLSFITPSLKSSLDDLLMIIGQKPTQFLSTSFSTLEWEALYIPKGYESHLLALHLWLNMEIEKLYKKRSLQYPHTSVFFDKNIWIAFELYSHNLNNLFFKWVFLKKLGVMNEHSRDHMLEQLLSMEQFPKNRLPWNCDRKADYLWQRIDDEYFTKNPTCSIEFSGVDYLWMLALLWEEN
jgi:hypothetical protein